MIKQVGFELYKMSRRPRSYLAFAAFLFINCMLMIGMKYGHMGSFALNSATNQAANQQFQLMGSPQNGEFMAWMAVASPFAITILTMFLPFFVCLIFGEIFAGESAEGTLRMVLSKPIKRSTFFVSKLIASLIYAVILVFFIGITAYLIGNIAFGRGGLLAAGTFQKPMLAWYGETDGLVRLGFAYLLTCLGMLTVGMIAFFISVWLNNALGAIGGAIMLLFASIIVGEIPYFKPIEKYLFSSHLFVGQNAFLNPVPWGDIRWAVICLSLYILSLGTISLLIFRRKDILT